MQKRSFRISEGSFLKYVDFTNSDLTNKICKALGRRGDKKLCVLSSYIRVDIVALWQIPLYNTVKRKGLSL